MGAAPSLPVHAMPSPSRHPLSFLGEPEYLEVVTLVQGGRRSRERQLAGSVYSPVIPPGLPHDPSVQLWAAGTGIPQQMSSFAPEPLLGQPGLTSASLPHHDPTNNRGEGKHQRWGEGRAHTECFHKLALDSSSHQFCEALPSAVYSQGNSGRKRLTDW